MPHQPSVLLTNGGVGSTISTISDGKGEGDMRHNGHGVRSVDHLAYCSGMNDWNHGFKVVLSLGTLAICLAADRAVVSLCGDRRAGVAAKRQGRVRLSAYIGLLRAPLVFLLLGGLAVACDISRVPAGDWSLPLPGFISVPTGTARALRAAGSQSAWRGERHVSARAHDNGLRAGVGAASGPFA